VRTDVDFQGFCSEISIAQDAIEIPSWLLHLYFDPLKLHRFDPQFEWREHAYFSSGAFACKRNVIHFEKWMEAESWDKEMPGLFADFAEQPLLNYFVHSMTLRGEVRSHMSNLQHVWEHYGADELKRDFAERLTLPVGHSSSACGSFFADTNHLCLIGIAIHGRSRSPDWNIITGVTVA